MNTVQTFIDKGSGYYREKLFWDLAIHEINHPVQTPYEPIEARNFALITDQVVSETFQRWVTFFDTDFYDRNIQDLVHL